MKDRIIEFAKNKGFDDIRFAAAAALQKQGLSGGAARPETLVVDPKDIMADAKSVIVLFYRYAPAAESENGWMNVSEYNRSSNRAYHMAKDITAFLIENGAKAKLDWRLYAKGTAKLTGGFEGRNGLYYHETLGSLVCIQTVITDMVLAQDYGKGEDRCGSCRACIKACPAGAISMEQGLDVKKCLRAYMNGLVPEEMREGVYQLFGCEICQAVCPLNKATPVSPVCFKTSELLKGMHLEELAVQAGKNTARSVRVISQAILYAGAARDRAMLPYIQKQLGSDSNTVREHAAWAIKRLNGEL